MNNKFGRDNRSRDPRAQIDEFRRDRSARESFWRGIDEDRGLAGPDREPEAGRPYREPDQYEYAPPYAPSYGQFGAQRRPLYGQYGGQGHYDSERSRFDGARDAAELRGGYSGRGPKGYTRTDERIREDVCERLSWSDDVDATDITVSVQGGEVTLEGSVETRHMKRLAEDIAEDVAGVVDVHNTVRVRKPILTEIKEKITGEAREEHYANTGTKTSSASANSSVPVQNGTR
jgi:hypothetical protein